MAYTKPQVIAQNASEGSYAAGCPTGSYPGSTTPSMCRKCEITQ